MAVIPKLVSAQTTEGIPNENFESHILRVCKELSENNKTTDHLSMQDLADLPIGIIQETSNGPVLIAIDSAFSNEQGWFFSAYATFTLPGTTKPIAFAAQNIAFGPGGLTASTQVRLHLVTSKRISISQFIDLELPPDGSNFIEFSCDGFQAINLSGNFIFDRSILEPAINKTKEVSAHFEINTHDLHNILMSVSIEPFQIHGIDDLTFEVAEAVADYSDVINPPGMILPKEYQDQLGENIQLWRGFFLKKVNIRLNYFSPDAPLITADNLLLDEWGVTGKFSASNLLVLQKGSVSGWPISIDAFSVGIQFNKMISGSLRGQIKIPLLTDEPLPYTAIIEQSEGSTQYKFSIGLSDKEYHTPFSATVKLNEGSIVSIEKRNDKLIPSAILQGSLIIAANSFHASEIKFENLGLTTEKPYVTSGDFSTKNAAVKLAGFSVGIDSIAIRSFQNELALGVGVSFGLMNKEDKGFSANTFIQILASEVPSPVNNEPSVNPSPSWKFDRIKIGEVKLETRSTAISLNGILTIFEDDPVFGNGFKGDLSFSLGRVLTNPIRTSAYFGSTESFKYWHLDAQIPTATIPVVPPILSIKGLIGGASYHMVRKEKFTPDFKMIGVASRENAVAEKTNDYLPDGNTGIGFMAGVTLIAGQEKVLNGDVLLEVIFNENGGIRQARFSGNAYFFTAINKRDRVSENSIPKTPVYANLNMLYDNENNVFHANLKTYINIAGAIRGTGPDGLVGEAVIHIDPNDWYIYIGRPSQMFGIDIAHLAVAQTYFMIGTQVENMPPFPQEVRDIISGIDQGLSRDESAMAGGRGFAAGAHLKVGFDSKNNLKPFYVMLMVGAGADVMLRDFGDAYCEGRTGPIGVDGWYASGQAYVFITGKVGVRIRKKDFDFLSLGAAAIMQAKLPNPTWLKGQLAGRYSLLGGLVKGKFHLKLVIGESCEIIDPGSDLDDIQVIADLSPSTNSNDVNVFTAPQVAFNTAVETPFTIMDAQDNINSYRVRLDKLQILNNNSVLPTSITWNSKKDVAVLKLAESLPEHTTLKLLVRVYWERKLSDGTWEPFKQDGQIQYEEQESIFDTGASPDFIPQENIAFSYPVSQQYNLLISESDKGYIKLKSGQSYLFENQSSDSQWSMVGRFQDLQQHQIDVPLQYDKGNTTITFSIPSNLEKETVYHFSLLKIPKSNALDTNLERGASNKSNGENEIYATTNTLKGTIVQSKELDIYHTSFRTSRFQTFHEKISALSGENNTMNIAVGNITAISKQGYLPETFDETELGKEGKALIQIVASENNRWLSEFASPALYSEYPIDPDIQISWRNPASLGVKPLKGVTISNTTGTYRLSTDTESISRSKDGTVSFGYYLSYYCYWDFVDLRNKAVAKFLDNWATAPTAAKKLLSVNGYTDLTHGNYPISIRYVLPGTEEITSQESMIIRY